MLYRRFVNIYAIRDAAESFNSSSQKLCNNYLETVSDHGGEFIPLVGESFGVWTPFALL